MLSSIVAKKQAPNLLWIVSGPSGSGKTTLCLLLLRKKELNIKRSISITTRALKKGEKNNHDYIFISKEEFLKKIKQKELVEWQEVFGNFYGTPKEAVKNAFKQKKDLLLCIDVKGALNVQRQFGDKAVSIFILPPNMKVLEERLELRARDNKKEMQKRLQSVKIEVSYAKNYDYVIVNDSLSKAVKDLEAIIIAKRCENVRNIQGRIDWQG